ncbi:MAG: PP0621 family protein [Sulfurimonas sp.]|jgi:uncharacterized protein
MLLKILLVIAVAVIIYFVFFKKKPIKNSDKLDVSDMVECSVCGVYTQIEDTIISNNKYYCSKECLEKR